MTPENMTFEENHMRAEDAYLRQACDATAEATVGRMFEAIGYKPGMVIVPADRIEQDAQHIDEMYGLVAAMNANHTASKTRIEKLEAALRPFARAEYISTGFDGNAIFARLQYAKDATETIPLVALEEARKALEGKDD